MSLLSLFNKPAPPAAPTDPMSLKVAATGGAIAPGVQLICFGPYYTPDGARSLVKFQPEVNMDIVHHMIMFGGRRQNGIRGHFGDRAAANSPTCNSGSIVYAWARTGQTTPIGLDYRDTKVDGDGFAVGPGTSYEWLSLQVHYQQLGGRSVPDASGVRLSFTPIAPRRPLDVQLMASWRLRIPPRVKVDECTPCRVSRGGVAVAWRNHAHRLARDIFSEHYARDGRPLGHLGRISAQQPQIFRVLPEVCAWHARTCTPCMYAHVHPADPDFRVLPKAVSLSAGETLLMHCQYDAEGVRDRVTYLGVDERTHEMCNQYLVATQGLRLDCGMERCACQSHS